ncbi:hypothetical protein Cgig2_023232 [Carnegiea gigantea]|uniref:Uncharacterized protein n=1 Tax=Carnegiea gigantea TaxID=171969 RepID=A0A9Q1GQA5_9CARY|nr:hypothetical protein Cgig2_023232 [Carnegiea gigantea]
MKEDKERMSNGFDEGEGKRCERHLQPPVLFARRYLTSPPLHTPPSSPAAYVLSLPSPPVAAYSYLSHRRRGASQFRPTRPDQAVARQLAPGCFCSTHLRRRLAKPTSGPQLAHLSHARAIHGRSFEAQVLFLYILIFRNINYYAFIDVFTCNFSILIYSYWDNIDDI